MLFIPLTCTHSLLPNSPQYLSYDNPTDADPLPSAPTTTAGRRRLAGVLGGASRDLLQLEKSGAELKIVVATNAARVDSEIKAFEEGVESGAMAQDFTLAGALRGGVGGQGTFGVGVCWATHCGDERGGWRAGL